MEVRLIVFCISTASQCLKVETESKQENVYTVFQSLLLSPSSQALGSISIPTLSASLQF